MTPYLFGSMFLCYPCRINSSQYGGWIIWRKHERDRKICMLCSGRTYGMYVG